MRTLLLSFLLFCVFHANAQKYVGPPNNVGREYGNPKMPWVVSHLAGKNKKMLERANKNSKHSFFGKIICFRRLCRIQVGHTASLHSVSFKKFKKRVARNGKKGKYKNLGVDSVYRPEQIRIDTTTTHKDIPILPDIKLMPTDTIRTLPKRIVDNRPRPDTLIVLGAELLFETNESTLRSEHFEILNSIVDYMLTHPRRVVMISGHTDYIGKEPHNLILSKQRADVVAEYLASNGVDVSRIDTEGLGSAKPVSINTTEEGRRKNRRVELLIRDRK